MNDQDTSQRITNLDRGLSKKIADHDERLRNIEGVTTKGIAPRLKQLEGIVEMQGKELAYEKRCRAEQGKELERLNKRLAIQASAIATLEEHRKDSLKYIAKLVSRVDNAYARIKGINNNMKVVLRALEEKASAMKHMHENLKKVAEVLGVITEAVYLEPDPHPVTTDDWSPAEPYPDEPGIIDQDRPEDEEPELDDDRCPACGSGNMEFVDAQPARADEPAHGGYWECDSCCYTMTDYEADKAASLADDQIKSEKENRK